MAAPFNSDILIAGILRVARDQADALAWLKGKHADALEAVMAGDEFVNSTSDEAGSMGSERGMSAAALQQLYEAALQVYEAQEGIVAGSPSSIRTGDFSCQPCILG